AGAHHRNRSSDRAVSAFPATFSSQPQDEPGYESNSGTYGLMSRSGVPSRTSTSSTSRVVPSTPVSRTTESPIAFGRLGERVEKTPRAVVSRKGVTVRHGSLHSWNA